MFRAGANSNFHANADPLGDIERECRGGAPFNETIGVQTYVHRVPNKGHIGLLVTDKARYQFVTLPLLKIQGKRQ